MVVKKREAILLHRALFHFPKHKNSREEADCFPFVATDVPLHDVYALNLNFLSQPAGYYRLLSLIDGVNLSKPQLYTFKTTTESDDFH